MAREGLRLDLTTALHRAVARKEPVRHEGVKVRTNGDFSIVNLTVRPVAGGMDLFLVILEEAPASGRKGPFPCRR